MSIALDMRHDGPSDERGELKGRYLRSLRMVERLHRLLLDVIKDEFEREGRADVNSVQALLLFNIGDSELTAGELRTRGYYLGSNVSYNLKKLVEMGYLSHPLEGQNLRNAHYLDRVAYGIARGVLDYLENDHPME